MEAPWDTMRDILSYVARAHAVSADCRLTMQEEFALLAARHRNASDPPLRPEAQPEAARALS